MTKFWWWVVAVTIAVGLGLAGWWGVKSRMAGQQISNTAPNLSEMSKPTGTLADISAAWTEQGVAIAGNYADADVVDLGDGSKRMYYAIEPEVKGNNLEVYSATSTDGISWKQESGTRRSMTTFPDVVRLSDGRWRMYFQNAGVIKSAISSDGLMFTDESGTRIDQTNDLGLTFENVAAPTVYQQADQTYLMVYRGTINQVYQGEKVPNQNTQILLWATSADGLAWMKKGLAVDSRNSTLYGLADGPELFSFDRATITLSFWSYSGVYWSTFANGLFSSPEKVFARPTANLQAKFPSDPAGDPAYAKFGNTWYMYYGVHEKGIYYATRSVSVGS